jgi:SAM-dependent methyltransferase
MESHEIIDQNLRAWNEVAPRHAEHNFANIARQLKATRGHFLDPVFRQHLEGIGLAGKTIAQFNCNNGRELISAVQLGARAGLGFDFSAAFIRQARDLCDGAGVNIDFIETNIYEIPARYSAVADVLMMTSGALCWMPDLRRYFEVASRVLGPGGSLVIYETHPFLEMFKLDRERAPEEALVPHYPYFMAEPIKSSAGLDYYSNEIYGREVVYWYHHTLSGIMQAIIDSGLTIRRFQEFEHDSDSGYARVRAFSARPPMSYLLSATKSP